MVAAALVVTARNPVHAALWLVLAFFSAAGVWLLLQAEFLAIVLVLVYVGAVMVLFLFVVMMLDVNFDKLRERFKSYMPVALTVGVLVLVRDGVGAQRTATSAAARRQPAADRRLQQHQGARRTDLHRLHLPVRDRGHDPAGGDHRGDRA